MIPNDAKYPENGNIPGFVFELKKAGTENDMEPLAEAALNQIEENRYDAQLKAAGVTRVIKIGIAFCGKHAAVKSI